MLNQYNILQPLAQKDAKGTGKILKAAILRNFLRILDR